MPTDPSKQAQQILELPAGQLDINTLNDRIQQMNLAFQKFLQNPALGAADLAQFKIINLADPKDDLDGVNLRTLKRFSGTGIAEQVTGAGAGTENPTIYFTFDGLPVDGETSPFALILANRDGFAPVTIGVAAVGAPVTDLEANVVVLNFGNVLAANLVLPAGSQGPAVSSSLALSAAFPTGTLLFGSINKSGGASQVTIALTLRGR